MNVIWTRSQFAARQPELRAGARISVRAGDSRRRPSLTRRSILAALPLAAALAFSSAEAQDKFIIVSSTTSTQDSGLFGHLLPIFRAKTGIEVRVVAQGTGQALDTGRRGDADVLFVHDKVAEEKFVADGFGVDRREVMYNDFVLIGPKSDPAKIAGTKDIAAALKRIAESKAPFASRGDKSGTHAAELRLWKLANVDPNAGKGAWYRETGQGMGPTLNVSSGMNAYVLADRGTWLSFKNRGELDIVVEGDQRLFNQYGVILVNPDKHKHVKKDLGMAFVNWITSPEGQKAIGDYTIDGQPLFFANYRKAGT
jgi:tungstate transport system substrate-binding protein